MLKYIIFASAMVAVAFSLNNRAYCNLDSCHGKLHTVCQYPSTNPSPRCGKVIKVGLTNEQKRQIVHKHNELRQKVASGAERLGEPGPQPRATNMQRLEWDNELEEVAQRWTNQCSHSHDKCRDVERFFVGQNLAADWRTPGHVGDRNVEKKVQSWYDEVKFFDANIVPEFRPIYRNDGNSTGHYTQLVWAETNKIGCGAINYLVRDSDYFLLICNYGPAGNMVGAPIYQTRWNKYKY